MPPDHAYPVQVLRIVRGKPTAEEVAALVAVFLRGRRSGPQPQPSRWARSARPAARSGWR